MGTSVYFTSAGDNQGVGDGARLNFQLGIGDASIARDLQFSADMLISLAKIWSSITVPSDAFMTAFVINHVNGAVVGIFTTVIELIPEAIELLSPKIGEIPAGAILRITVYNGTVPSAFIVKGILRAERQF